MICLFDLNRVGVNETHKEKARSSDGLGNRPRMSAEKPIHQPTMPCEKDARRVQAPRFFK